MENNIYAQHKMEIKAISERENVDIGVACAMLRHEKGWFEGEKDTQITEFTGYIHGLSAEDTIAYFAE